MKPRARLSGNGDRRFRIALGSTTGSSYRVGTALNQYLKQRHGYELDVVPNASPGNAARCSIPRRESCRSELRLPVPRPLARSIIVQWNRWARHPCWEMGKSQGETMKTASLVTAVLLALSGYAFAQDGEQTIALLPQDADLPDVVTAAIELPKDAEGVYRPSVKAVERSAEGIATANAAREDGRAFGQSMATQAKEDRELRSRGERPDFADLLPEQVPDDVTLPTLPERPELPELPALPERPALPELPTLPERPVTPPAPPGRP